MADLERRWFATGIACFIAGAATMLRGPSAQEVESKADARLCRKRDGCIEASKDKDELWAWNYKTDKCEEAGYFLTTACCKELGLGDNCYKQRTLLHCRDSYLMYAPQGREHVAAYHDPAPMILAAIPPNRRRPELLTVYAYFILPCVLWTRLGLYRAARDVYTALMNRMIRRHLSSDHHVLTVWRQSSPLTCPVED